MGIYLTWKVGDKEFRVRFQNEIEDWLRYQDQKRFERVIEVMIKDQMKKFHVTPEEISEIVKKMIKRPTFTITIIEAIE